MKKKKNERFPKNYKYNNDEEFTAPEILIRRGKEYKFVQKLKYLYLYQRTCIAPNGRISTFKECFDNFDIRLLEFYKGESGEYK